MKVSTIKKYSKKTYSQLHAMAKRWFHKYIRLRDTDANGYGRCISSGQSLKYGSANAHAGHFFKAETYRHLEFNEWNVNLQGLSDNYFRHGNESMYAINLKRKIGAAAFAELEQMALMSKRIPYKEDRYTMIEIIEKYKIKEKEISKMKMFKV